MTLLIAHIPKSAGSSLKKLVRTWTPDVVWAYGGELALGCPDLDFARQFRSRQPPTVVMGHFSFGAHRQLGLKPTYATVLRNPITRVRSLYRYQKSLPDSRFRDQFDAGMDLDAFVRSEITEMTNNHACRVIAGIAPESGTRINETWLLDLALHNLERHFELVGLVENMRPMLTALARRLDWPPVELPQVNVTRGLDVALTQAEQDIIAEYNQLDLALYEHVVRLGQKTESELPLL